MRQKIDQCKNNSENLSASKRSEHISSGFSISRILSFRDIQNKYDVYRGKKCIKKVLQIFKKVCSADFEKEKNEVTTNEQLESYEDAKICRNWKKSFKINILKINKYCKVKDHCYYTVEYGGAAHSICHLK